MPFPPSRRAPGAAFSLIAAAALGTAPLAMAPFSAAPVRAQATPGLMEFRWDNNKDYRKLYYFITESVRQKRSEYYLILRPKDRKTAILKLTISIPDHFESVIKSKDVKLCKMSEGGMLKRTRCQEEIPATVEVSSDSGSIDIFPETPISDKDTIGVYMRLFNPPSIGMYQFNAMAQAPGELPISGYLGSWLIQIDAN
jgi:hypothetical protein